MGRPLTSSSSSSLSFGQIHGLLNKLSAKAEDFSVSMMDVEHLVYVPSHPEELEKKRKTEGFPVGSRAYAAAFEKQFMSVLDKLVGDQKVRGQEMVGWPWPHVSDNS